MTTSPNGVDQAQAIAAAAASNNHNDHSKSTTKGVALLLLLTISLLTIFSASNTIYFPNHLKKQTKHPYL